MPNRSNEHSLKQRWQTYGPWARHSPQSPSIQPTMLPEGTIRFALWPCEAWPSAASYCQILQPPPLCLSPDPVLLLDPTLYLLLSCWTLKCAPPHPLLCWTLHCQPLPLLDPTLCFHQTLCSGCCQKLRQPHCCCTLSPDTRLHMSTMVQIQMRAPGEFDTPALKGPNLQYTNSWADSSV